MGLATDELEARSGDGYAEGKGVHLLASIGAQRAIGRDEQLVGEWGEGCQRLGPAHDDTFGGGVDDAEWHVGVGLLAHGGATVDLGVPEGVGHADVLLAGVLVEGAYVVSEPLLLVAEVLRHLAGGRELDVHVVGGAAHHPLGGIGDYLQGATPADEVVVGVGDDVGEGDGLAAAG